MGHPATGATTEFISIKARLERCEVFGFKKTACEFVALLAGLLSVLSHVRTLRDLWLLSRKEPGPLKWFTVLICRPGMAFLIGKYENALCVAPL
jgi:hypothetical protein